MTDIIAGRRVDGAALERLQGSMDGGVVAPDDERYEQARRVWNAAADRHPALIAECSGTADVRRALEFAREEDLTVAVRGGGHSVPGFSTCDDGIVIDLGPMQGILVDPAAKRVRAQGGVRWGSLDRETQQFGLATTGGTVSITGLAGLTLGGGMGWLMRRHGLVCDNLVSVDVVTADGQFVRASEAESPDLFWALRGGGGNFGIATALEYQLHPVGPIIYGGPIAYDPSKAGPVLRGYRELTEMAPRELTTDGVLMGLGPEDTPVAAIAACYAGSVEDGEKVLAPARAFGTPVADGLGPMPYVTLQAILDEKFAAGQFHYWTARTFDRLDHNVLEIIIERWMDANLSMVPTILIEHLGGAVADVAPDATAFAEREANYEILVMAHARDRASFEQGTEWARAVLEAIDPFSRGGGYVNYLEDGGEREVRVAYRDRYDRLAALKRRYDPDNVFRLNQNIPPAPA